MDDINKIIGNTVQKLTAAYVDVRQVLNDYFYWVYKLEIDPTNVDTIQRYRPRAGWTWKQCLDLIQNDTHIERASLKELRQLTYRIKLTEEKGEQENAQTT